MRKLLSIVLVLALGIGLAGCGGLGRLTEEEELAFKSVLDTETGTLITLGDRKDKLDELWGYTKGGIIEDFGGMWCCTYLDDTVVVTYTLSGYLMDISIDLPDGDRFSYQGVNLSAPLEEISTLFKNRETNITYDDDPQKVPAIAYYFSEYEKKVDRDIYVKYRATVRTRVNSGTGETIQAFILSSSANSSG